MMHRLAALAILALGMGSSAVAAAADGPQIINGVDAAQGRWPMQVSIQFGSPRSHNCGGTLISNQWVLTAAHCFFSSGRQTVFAGDVTVIAGTNNNSDGSGQSRNVARMITHADYNDGTKNNDIALLQLDQAVAIVNPITLATPATEVLWAPAGQTVTAVGWGNTSTTGNVYPAQLKQVDVNMVARDTCNAAASYNGSINTNMLCAAAAGKDTCQGDSGGPLFVSNRAGGVVQIGVTSFGIGCANPSYPGIYARVSQYNDWIAARVPETLFATTRQSGWWYVAGQSGRGYSIEIRGNKLFFAGYMYETDGAATWYISSGAMASADSYSGTLQKFSGGQTLTGAYAAATSLGSVGALGITFTSDTTATMVMAGQTLSLVRFEITAGGVAAGPSANQPETGWYWNATEGGRGYFIEAQNNQVFFAAFMYRADGQPTWYYFGTPTTPTAGDGIQVQAPLSACTGGQTLTDATRSPSCAALSQNLTFQFPNPFTATMTLPDGRAVALTRFPF